MMNWRKKVPPYEGPEPYVYFAFSEADRKKVWKILRPLLERGCRVWYAYGPAGGADRLLHNQERAANAALTLVYLSDDACSDKDMKGSILVNQKYDRPILCLDPDGLDRRLSMGLREDVPHIPLYQLRGKGEIESDVIHAEGFSQDVLGAPPPHFGGALLARLSALFCALAILISAAAFVGTRYFHWFRPEPQDELTFSDPVILSSLRRAARGGSITEDLADSITLLQLDGMPESWDDLALLPALERIELPQQALLEGGALPEGDYVIELSGGDGA